MIELKEFPCYYATKNGDIYSSKSNKVLRKYNHVKGYLFVELCINGKRVVKTIHRLIAKAYISNPDNKPQVNHINGNKKDNSVINLEWSTNSENQKHAYSNGLKVFYNRHKKIPSVLS
jgi:hypothetical protein